MVNRQGFKFFAGRSHPELAKKIATHLGAPLGAIQIETFPDNEIGVLVSEDVRGRDVFVLQTIARHPNSYLMELLIIVDALKRASAGRITAVIPYLGYARQDRKDREHTSITAKLVANLIERAGVDRLLTLDLHTQQVQGFFDIEVANLTARPLLAQAIKKWGLKSAVVVSSDVGSVKLVRGFAESLGVDYAIIDKRRVSAKQVETEALIGDVRGKEVILIDDLISTGMTLKTGCEVCLRGGAKRVFAAVTHNLMTGKAFEESAITKIITTDTVPLPPGVPEERVERVSVAALLAEAIKASLSLD